MTKQRCTTYVFSRYQGGPISEVLSYNSKEVELIFEDEVDSENEISVGKYVKDNLIHMRLEKKSMMDLKEVLIDTVLEG